MTPDEMAAAHLWRCEATARQLTRHRPRDLDEAHSVALLALGEALAGFDDARVPAGVNPADRLAVHVHLAIRRKVLHFLHLDAPKGYRRRLGLPPAARPDVIAFSACDGIDVAEGADSPPGWAMEWEEHLRALAGLLPDRHGAVFLGRYLHADGERLEAVAINLGLSRPKAYRLHREAIAMIREHFAGREAG